MVSLDVVSVGNLAPCARVHEKHAVGDEVFRALRWPRARSVISRSTRDLATHAQLSNLQRMRILMFNIQSILPRI